MRSLALSLHADRPLDITSWLWALDDARRRTLETLAGMDAALIDVPAGPQGETIGMLLYHIAAIEADWLFADVLEREFPEAVTALFPHDVRDGAGHLSNVIGQSLDEHLARLATVRSYLHRELKSLPDADWRRVRQMTGYTVTPEWVLHHLLQHEAEHRGQIGWLHTLAKAT
ncbi:MAG TPA: DinB family protein [Roseiflexaceae bacterium]|nr:DinB family protein [Roseiflexaceae bacterium]HMP40276.1 DinB family protein [Roseiflexaceae bacterium]